LSGGGVLYKADKCQKESDKEIEAGSTPKILAGGMGMGMYMGATSRRWRMVGGEGGNSVSG